MSKESYIILKNNSLPVDFTEIPVLEYDLFSDLVKLLLKEDFRHCVAYDALESDQKLKFLCCIADDQSHELFVFSHEAGKNGFSLKSLTPECPQMQNFEREIHENFGVQFEGHPWLKPVRYAYHRADQSKVMDNYPFFEIESEELHEVGVGPIHAGVIEPGHFRFICNGENVLHLEIHLGYQHRGIENLFLEKENPLQRCILAESIAGDTAIGHALAHAQLMESLAGITINKRLQIERCIALELERLAVHIGDTAALCTDVAYQLGQVVCEALRTTIINTTQLWCGNRFGKGLIRPGGTNYPLNETVTDHIEKVLEDTGKRFIKLTDLIYSLPSVLSRFDGIGIVTKEQSQTIGAVGMAARTTGIPRDVRSSHPFQFFKSYKVEPVLTHSGDVLARGMQRNLEARQSIHIIKELISEWQKLSDELQLPDYHYQLKPNSFAVSMVEGWRGEICHSAITDERGRVIHYKVKDPSFHNWMALALAVRNQEISDFPVCNKSFNLSYCGFDL